ncbi:MAG: DmsE family decaheme c-type cytochrome [Oligoflexia bacterium]|nr:DmsE family decaheme c-type cytochrome [Oligoflexia bacterium]
MKKYVLLPVFCLLAAGALLLPGAALAADEPQSCAKCHEDEVAGFKGSHHVRAWSSKEDQAKNSCSTCHGDGAEHIKAEGKAPMPIPMKGKNIDAAKANDSCLKCHNQTGNLAFWGAGKHGKNDLTCASCHSMHGKGTVKPGPDVCFTCHKDVKHDSMKLSHHPIIEGKVSCSDCHNPHGTLNHGMLRAESTNQLCYKCHTDKRGPYVWEHPPVEENCLSCHVSHGSRNQKLLVEKTPNLCQNCHEWSRHPSTAYQGNGGFENVKTSTFKSQLAARSCQNCHPKIHGSFAPHNPASGRGYNGGKYFVR